MKNLLKLKKTKLEGVLKITAPQTFFKDKRGYFIETYNKEYYEEKLPKIKFIQDDISISKKNVLRGFHGDHKTWKLVSCIFGKIFFVVLNCDLKSKSFGKWESFILSHKNYTQILIPPSFGNAYYVLSDSAIFQYKQSSYYSGMEKQFTYKWNDKRFNIKWPCKKPILSKRDS